MEAHGIGQALRAWVSNHLLGHRDYLTLEGLATEGKAVLQAQMNSFGGLTITATKTYENELLEATVNLDEAKKQIKTQEKGLRSCEKEIKNQNKTIGELRKEIKSLKAEAKKKAVAKIETKGFE